VQHLGDLREVDLLDRRPSGRRISNVDHRGEAVPLVREHDDRPVKRGVAFHEPSQELEPVNITHLDADDDDGGIDVLDVRQRSLCGALDDHLGGRRSAEDASEIGLVRIALRFGEDAQDALRGHGAAGG
jgi:hypothetical protein